MKTSFMKRIFTVLTVCLCLGGMLIGCSGNKTSNGGGDLGETVMVQIEMENGGIIKLELYPEIAPITVENFTKLVSEGFYDGLIFHRVIKDFMIQGGDPEGTGMGGSKDKIKGEFAINGVQNTLSHERGVISMARSQNYNSASSQFFICHADSTYLDGQYAAFGKVIEGIETVDSIAAVEVEYDSYGREKSVPTEDVIIEYVKVLTEITTDTTAADTTEAVIGEIK